ncbi:hypothetical protein GA0115258_113757 [Streptomyces sp. LamerLS-31b]|nr:hypothetical protein GA0115258_113757 [Streptomyces sp. LamerLS-31b]
MWCSPPTWWCASPPERGAGGPPGRRRLAPPSTGCCGARPGIRIRLRARMSGARRLPTGRTGCRRGRRAAAESGVRPAPSRRAGGHSGMDAARRSPPPPSGRAPHRGIDLPSGRVPRRGSICHPGVCHAGGRPGIRAGEAPGHRPGTRRPRRRGAVIGPASSSDPASLCARRRGRSRHLCVAPGECAAPRGFSAVPAIAEWLFLRLAFGPVRRPAPDGPSPLPGGRRSLRRASSPDAASSPWSRAVPPRRRRPHRPPRRGGA